MQEHSNLKKSRLSQVLEFIREYRINISPAKRLSGVGDTLLGWGFIAINTVFFSPPTNLILTEVNFIIFFLAGCLALFLYTVLENLFQGTIAQGIKGLLINYDNEIHAHEVHLTKAQRVRWVYFRGLVATGGYIAYSISKVYFGAIDNSEIFDADALVYALLAFLLLHEKFNFKECLGIIIASIGVLFIFFLDIESISPKDAMIGGIAGLMSAIALTIIFFITGIIVRHDTPIRVAFHQCIAGLFLAFIALFITLILKVMSNGLLIPNMSSEFIKNSLISGVLYAVALVFFLRAFIRTEPIVIAVVGYSLGIFIVLLEWLFKGSIIGGKEAISAFLIGFGSFLLIHQEYVKDRKKSREIKMQRPVYQMGLRDELASLKERFRAGALDKYSYLSEKHEFNKVLLEYTSQIANSPIESIRILHNALIFNFKEPLNFELETDGGARSAPFEILNFGSYESEDEKMAYNLLTDGDTILDVGAHIGWYAINFAKRFPHSKIFAFEPIETTFSFLKRNIERNDIKNVFLCNYGCSNKKEEKFLYYFKGGSALASIENLINHENAQKIKCILKPIDDTINELGIKSLEFIKCDAEGSELFVLQGAQSSIKKFKPIIFTELYEEWCRKCGYSSSDVLKLLNLWGYEPFQVFKGKLKKIESNEFNDSERYNYFFLNQEKHKDLISKNI